MHMVNKNWAAAAIIFYALSVVRWLVIHVVVLWVKETATTMGWNKSIIRIIYMTVLKSH